MEFKEFLKNIKYPNKKQSWNIEGTLENGHYKFDTRPIQNNVKIGSFQSKADKMVFDLKDQFINVDTEELHQYLKEKNLKEVHLQSLISDLEWNIILPKN